MGLGWGSLSSAQTCLESQYCLSVVKDAGFSVRKLPQSVALHVFPAKCETAPPENGCKMPCTRTLPAVNAQNLFFLIYDITNLNTLYDFVAAMTWTTPGYGNITNLIVWLVQHVYRRQAPVIYMKWTARTLPKSPDWYRSHRPNDWGLSDWRRLGDSSELPNNFTRGRW